MIDYYRLSRNPRWFKSFSGVTVIEFEELYAPVVPVWTAQEQARLNRAGRQRAVGGGRPYDLPLREWWLLTLLWLKLYLTTEALGYLFGVDNSTVSRNLRRLLPTLQAWGTATLGWATPPARGQTQSLAQACAEQPDWFAIVDATEQSVRRASDSDTERQHYSGKKKRHTRKTQIIVNEQGEIRAVSASTPGRVHDLEHFRQSGAPAQIPLTVGVLGDAGYQGLQDELPDHSGGIAHKARRNHPLTGDEKAINREFSPARIIVENTWCALKHFHCLAQCFRHAMDLYDTMFLSVRLLSKTEVSLPGVCNLSKSLAGFYEDKIVLVTGNCIRSFGLSEDGRLEP